MNSKALREAGPYILTDIHRDKAIYIGAPLLKKLFYIQYEILRDDLIQIVSTFLELFSVFFFKWGVN